MVITGETTSRSMPVLDVTPAVRDRLMTGAFELKALCREVIAADDRALPAGDRAPYVEFVGSVAFIVDLMAELCERPVVTLIDLAACVVMLKDAEATAQAARQDSASTLLHNITAHYEQIYRVGLGFVLMHDLDVERNYSVQ